MIGDDSITIDRCVQPPHRAGWRSVRSHVWSGWLAEAKLGKRRTVTSLPEPRQQSHKPVLWSIARVLLRRDEYDLRQPRPELYDKSMGAVLSVANCDGALRRVDLRPAAVSGRLILLCRLAGAGKTALATRLELDGLGDYVCIRRRISSRLSASLCDVA